MDNIKKVLYIFVVLSIIFLIGGLFSAMNLAYIEKSRDTLISENPQNVRFQVIYNNTSYVPHIVFTINNPGHLRYCVKKVTWQVFLLNGSKKYQANNYGYMYLNDEICVSPHSAKDIKIVDTNTTTLWRAYVMHQLRWLVGHNLTVKWYTTLSIDGWLGDFNTKEYQYNIRTWYLWKLPEVVIEYEGTS